MFLKSRLSKSLAFAGVTLFASLGFLYYQNHQVPDLGVTDGRFRPLRNTPNGVSTQASDDEKRVDTLPFKESQQATMEALVKAVSQVPGSEIKVRDDNYLYVVFTTPTMRFHDDAEFWLDPEQSKVHFRSQSRVGYSDVGLNKKRYLKITKLYQGS
jgi:uncharacterized protein (DUF1499 family)